MIKNPWIKEAILYQNVSSSHKVQCLLCERRCIIEDKGYGYCKTRKNIRGRLYTLEYGLVSSISLNPIEKKPFFHFYPASLALTIGSYSCNFPCIWCQNWHISKINPETGGGTFISVDRFLKLMELYNASGTSISFNEPTLLLEYALELFPLAKQKGYYNTFVSNGYMTKEALLLLIEKGLDAINIDIKFGKEGYKRYLHADQEVIWRNASICKHYGVHVELTTLVIPGLNDDLYLLREIAKNIKDRLSCSVPWHINRYFPAYKLNVAKTPVETLNKAWEIAKEEGLEYVYIGNVLNEKESTYCPSCNKLVIKRRGLDVLEYLLTEEKRCPYCKKEIPIVGTYKGN